MEKIYTVQATAFERLIEGLEAAGVDADALLREFAVDRKLVSDPEARVPFQKLAALFEAGAERSGDDCFGLHLGVQAEPQMFDALGYAVMSCPNLEAALLTACRYHRVLNDGGEMRLEVKDDTAHMVFRIRGPKAGSYRQVTEDKVTHFCRIVEIISSPGWRPLEVRFEHPAPRNDGEYRHVFACPVLFDQAHNGFSFDAALLAGSLPTADARLLRIMVRVIEKTLRELPAPDEFLRKVRKLLVDSLPHGKIALSDIAERLGVSTRTLQRRFSDCGISYHRLLGQTRQRLSMSYLRQTGLKVSEIAFLLGYTDVSAFSRAFLRWTALTPGEYRRASSSRDDDGAR